MAGYESDNSESNKNNSTNINTTTNHSTTHHQNQNSTTPNSINSMVGAASPNHSNNQIDQKPYITNNNNLTNSSLLHSSSSSLTPSASAAVIPGQTSLSSHFSHYSSSAYPNVTASSGVLHNTPCSSTTGVLTNPVSTSSYTHQHSSVPQHSAPHHMSYMGYSSLDVKPSHLADWYSHAGMTSMAMHGMAATPGMTTAGGRYDSNPHVGAGKVPYHVAAALPTPPSTGHSPIQSLSNHLNLLPSTTSAVAYT